MTQIFDLFYFDRLFAVMALLIGFVALTVGRFAYTYMQGDRAYKNFWIKFSGLITSTLIMVGADHIIIFISAWALSNFLLVALMIHKSEWLAAKASGGLAFKTLGFGTVCLCLGGGYLYSVTGVVSIQEVNTFANNNAIGTYMAVALISITALTQSGLWPFHKWLLNSLNSPTPVSAMMHAGLVNGGGFLLARFAPLHISQPLILKALFIIGSITALLGTAYKLVQNDVKRMLACSTMAQMGFMVMQCGLGLFPAAIAHLCWHGLFKAYLFLNSGSAAQEPNVNMQVFFKPFTFLIALLCGAAGAAAFSWASDRDLMDWTTDAFLIGIAFIAGLQLSQVILKDKPFKRVLLALFFATGSGLFYGGSVNLIEDFLEPLNMRHPQLLDAWHIVVFAVFCAGWAAIRFKINNKTVNTPPAWLLRLYVRVWSQSQPNHETTTIHRQNYKF